MTQPINIFWFRRDLRLDDNVGFCEALKDDAPVLPIFIFDTEILDKLPKNDARVTFIHDTLQDMRQELQDGYGSSIAMYYGNPIEVYQDLINEYDIKAIYTNHDYEPYARERDTEIRTFLESNTIAFKTFKDQVIFEKDEVVKKDGDATGELGSTARTATRLPSDKSKSPNRSMKVDFPTPGTPEMPMRMLLPVCGSN